MRKIHRVIIHCSDSPDARDLGAKEIKQWHTDPVSKGGRGFKNIGYHAVVRRNGSIESGRPESEVGAHVKGHNSDSLGVVWVGRTRMTEVQKESLIEQIWDWIDQYGLTVNDVYGHHELDPKKTCPNFQMDKFRQELEDWVDG